MRRARLSQEGLARRVREEGARLRRRNSCSRSTVARWLACQAEPLPDYLAALEAVFGRPASSLGFADDGPAPGVFPVAAGGASIVPASGSLAYNSLLAASPDGDDAAAMRAFRKADLRAGGGHLYSSVTGYLRTRIAPRLVTAAGRGIFTAAAAVTEMAGWMAHDAGRDQLAGQHFRRALDLVSVNGDRQVTAHVLASTGHLAHHAGDAAGALRAARAGLAALAGGPPDPDLEAHLRCIEARGLAALRDGPGAARCLLAAEKALAAARSGPRSEWVPGFDEGSLANEAARVMLQLGQLREAKHQAARVMALRPAGRPRSRAFGMYVHARVLIAAGEPGEASATAAEILQVTDGLGSAVVVAQLITLARLLEPSGTDAAVSAFLARLGPALRERQWMPDALADGGDHDAQHPDV